jgi:hypothetical protein
MRNHYNGTIALILAASFVFIGGSEGPAAAEQAESQPASSPDLPRLAIVVSDTAELVEAVAQANSGGETVIELEDGTYTLDEGLLIEAGGVTVTSVSGERSAVVIEGAGMDGEVTHIFSVAGADFTVEDVTLGRVSLHAIQLQPDVDGIVIRNVHVLDTGEQMIQVAYDPDDLDSSSDNGLVEGSLFEYSAGVDPRPNSSGIVAHNAKDWEIRDNIFKDIRSPTEDVAEFAIHFMSGSEDTLVERNLIINCDRGIGFGMGEQGHQGGVIRNNMIYHDAGEGGVGIGLESAADPEVYNNTLYQEHSYPNAIEARFAETTGAFIANNLTNRSLVELDGASAEFTHNVDTADGDWFIDPDLGDLHLGSAIAEVVDQGIEIPDLTDDFDEDGRPQGSGIDIGADELVAP